MKESFTYRQIGEANQAAVQLGMMRVGQKTAYKLARIIEKTKSIGKDINKGQLEFYKKYGHEKTQGKNDWTIPEDKQVEFMKEFDEFMDGTTVEIEFMPVACNMFEELPANCILGMGNFMIEEEKIVLPSTLK